MTDDKMNISRSTMHSLLPHLESSLKSFQSSTSAFRIVKTINPSSTLPPSPKTLIILDSSFNPPQTAHLALARSALLKSYTTTLPAPYRLLLLFSTHNADKAPSAASFPQRLALMTIFAEDLLRQLQQDPNADHEMPAIDIGLTNAPYYTDKSAAIADQGREVYPDRPRHVHLMGFDTITRFFAAKYYPNHDPPLSALTPFFAAGHRLRVTVRPTEEYGTLEEQKAFFTRLAEGALEKDGGKREWAEQVDVVEAAEGEGVSSTQVRKAAKDGNWAEVERLCTAGVAEAVKGSAVYDSDDRGSKMA